MDTSTAVVATGLIVAVGQWAQDKPISIRQFVGVGVLAISLSLIGATNAQLAQQFATLILVAALMVYMLPISKKMGFTK